MLTIDEFVQALPLAISRFCGQPPNERQESCIRQAASQPLMIVAGPGSGKTTVLVLRALRHVFVDAMLPEQIIITTFTKKAAAEIRARLLDWGGAMHAHVHDARPENRSKLDLIDVNRFVTGTLDSICEDVVTTQRDPGDPVPVLAEGFVANAWLLRQAIRPAGAYQNTDLDNYLASFTFERDPPRNAGELTAVARTLVDRFVHDRVDMAKYRSSPPQVKARALMAAVVEKYDQFLANRGRLDFARLEQRLCSRMASGGYARFVSGVRAVLVDEYQDTNPLQEQIYFQLVDKASASFTVVGDDDQSLYRFRGATVELFRDFIQRFSSACPTRLRPQRIDLVENYRSTPEIVAFFNAFVANDPDFAPARVQPLKPLIAHTLPSNGAPVLGLFRPTRAELAADLARFLLDVFRNGGRQVTGPAGPTTIAPHPRGGDFGDAVYLAHTVAEYGARFGSTPPTPTLSKLLRDELSAQNVRVFNPRGRLLRDIDVVQQLLGLMLECIDPPQGTATRGRIEESTHLRGDMLHYFEAWRLAARRFVATNPDPATPHGIESFVRAWQRRTPPKHMAKWPEEWPLLELLFKLLSWFPGFRVDPEGQVYLEALSRGIAAAATFSAYKSLIRHGSGVHDDRSVLSALHDVFGPIAEAEVDVDEDIMPHVPRDCFSMMTVHQAKGLEYPLVIVDVGGAYARDHHKQRFRRFPDTASTVAAMEDDVSPFCDIGTLRGRRSALHRTFEDLVRLYYVAYSRPQSVLVLVGVDKCLAYETSIKHVGLFWRQDGTWPWRQDVPNLGQRVGRRKVKAPPMVTRFPQGFTLI